MLRFVATKSEPLAGGNTLAIWPNSGLERFWLVDFGIGKLVGVSQGNGRCSLHN